MKLEITNRDIFKSQTLRNIFAGIIRGRTSRISRQSSNPRSMEFPDVHAPANLPPRIARLNDEFVRNGFEEGGLVVLSPDDVGGSWAYGLPLEVWHGGSVLLALASGRVVALHAVQEILSAAGMPDVFGSDANLFLLDPVPHGFGDDDVADLVVLKQRRHGRHSVLAERTTEHVPGSAPISLGIRHFYLGFLVEF